MDIKIISKGLDKNKSFLNEITNNLDDENSKIIHQIGLDIVDKARNNLQNNTNIDSGTLLSSIKILEDDGDSIMVGSDEKYAGYVEFGRGPVKPLKPGGTLHWIDKNGKDVYAKYAEATEPSPFLQPAVEESIKGISGLYVSFVDSSF